MGKIHKNGFSLINHPIWNILEQNFQDMCKTLLRILQIQYTNFHPKNGKEWRNYKFVSNTTLEFFSLYMLLYWKSIFVRQCILATVSNN